MEVIDASACEGVGGGMTPLQLWQGFNGVSFIAQGVYNFTNALGATLRNYYGDETTLEAFRGGNLGA